MADLSKQIGKKSPDKAVLDEKEKEALNKSSKKNEIDKNLQEKESKSIIKEQENKKISNLPPSSPLQKNKKSRTLISNLENNEHFEKMIESSQNQNEFIPKLNQSYPTVINNQTKQSYGSPNVDLSLQKSEMVSILPSQLTNKNIHNRNRSMTSKPSMSQDYSQNRNTVNPRPGSLPYKFSVLNAPRVMNDANRLAPRPIETNSGSMAAHGSSLYFRRPSFYDQHQFSRPLPINYNQGIYNQNEHSAYREQRSAPSQQEVGYVYTEPQLNNQKFNQQPPIGQNIPPQYTAMPISYQKPPPAQNKHFSRPVSPFPEPDVKTKNLLSNKKIKETTLEKVTRELEVLKNEVFDCIRVKNISGNEETLYHFPIEFEKDQIPFNPKKYIKYYLKSDNNKNNRYNDLIYLLENKTRFPDKELPADPEYVSILSLKLSAYLQNITELPLEYILEGTDQIISFDDWKHAKREKRHIRVIKRVHKMIKENVDLKKLLLKNSDHKQAQSFIGDQKQAQSFIGDQKQAQSFIGDQKQAQSFIGDHKQAQSFIGDHKQAQSFIGDQKQVQSFIGDQKQVQSFIGTEHNPVNSVHIGTEHKQTQSFIGTDQTQHLINSARKIAKEAAEFVKKNTLEIDGIKIFRFPYKIIHIENDEQKMYSGMKSTVINRLKLSSFQKGPIYNHIGKIQSKITFQTPALKKRQGCHPSHTNAIQKIPPELQNVTNIQEIINYWLGKDGSNTQNIQFL